MLSGIKSYSGRLIEGLGSFGRLAAFFFLILTNKIHNYAIGRGQYVPLAE